jgi:hypothetical protein
MRWKFRLSRDGQTVEVIEQLAFADVGPDGISRLDLLCSGFLPDGADAAPETDAARAAPAGDSVLVVG